MKKLFIATGILIIAIVTVTNSQTLKNGKNFNVSLNDIITMAMADPEGGGNEATCYSTYTSPIIGGTNIWVCGSCVQDKAKNFSDAGICYF